MIARQKQIVTRINRTCDASKLTSSVDNTYKNAFVIMRKIVSYVSEVLGDVECQNDEAEKVDKYSFLLQILFQMSAVTLARIYISCSHLKGNPVNQFLGFA